MIVTTAAFARSDQNCKDFGVEKCYPSDYNPALYGLYSASETLQQAENLAEYVPKPEAHDSESLRSFWPNATIFVAATL